jgi:hypothetical protein
MKREDITTIDIMQVTIRSSERYWSSENIFKFLKQIEECEGFKGFLKVSFSVEELPEIVCYFNFVKNKKELGNKLSKLLRRKNNE